MNTADIEKYLREVVRISEQNAPFAKAVLEAELFIFEYWLPFTLFFIVWYALHVHATWTNLRDNTGIDRLTWLMAIWLPFGLIFYWCLGRPSSDPSIATARDKLSTSQPVYSERDTASDINAALAEESRKRREQNV